MKLLDKYPTELEPSMKNLSFHLSLFSFIFSVWVQPKYDIFVLSCLSLNISDLFSRVPVTKKSLNVIVYFLLRRCL